MKDLTLGNLINAIEMHVHDDTLDLDLYNDYVSEFCEFQDHIWKMDRLDEVKNIDQYAGVDFDALISTAKSRNDWNDEDDYFYFYAPSGSPDRIHSAKSLADTGIISPDHMAICLFDLFRTDFDYAEEHFWSVWDMLE